MSNILQDKIIAKLKKKRLDSHDFLFVKSKIQQIYHEETLLILDSKVGSLRKNNHFLQNFLWLIRETKRQIENTLNQDEQNQMHNSAVCCNAKEVMLHAIICKAIKQFYNDSLNGEYNEINILSAEEIEDEQIKYAETTGWNKYSREILFVTENIEDFFIFLARNQVFKKVHDKRLWEETLLIHTILAYIKKEVINTKITSLEPILEWLDMNMMEENKEHTFEDFNLNILDTIEWNEFMTGIDWLAFFKQLHTCNWTFKINKDILTSFFEKVSLKDFFTTIDLQLFLNDIDQENLTIFFEHIDLLVFFEEVGYDLILWLEQIETFLMYIPLHKIASQVNWEDILTDISLNNFYNESKFSNLSTCNYSNKIINSLNWSSILSDEYIYEDIIDKKSFIQNLITKDWNTLLSIMDIENKLHNIILKKHLENIDQVNIFELIKLLNISINIDSLDDLELTINWQTHQWYKNLYIGKDWFYGVNHNTKDSYHTDFSWNKKHISSNFSTTDLIPIYRKNWGWYSERYKKDKNYLEIKNSPFQGENLKVFLEAHWIEVEKDESDDLTLCFPDGQKRKYYTTLYIKEDTLYWKHYSNGTIERISLLWEEQWTVDEYPDDAVEAYDKSLQWFTKKYSNSWITGSNLKEVLKSRGITLKKDHDNDLVFSFNWGQNLSYYTTFYLSEEFIYSKVLNQSTIHKITLSWETQWTVQSYPDEAVKVYEKDGGWFSYVYNSNANNDNLPWTP